MTIADIIYKYFPVKYFKALRSTYYRLNKKVHSPTTEQEFKNFITGKLGIKKGMVVYIHSSIDKLNLDFSPFRLLELLLETVGEDGTLVFPCWHYRGRAENFYKNKDAFFDVNKSVTTMGLLPELARRHKNAARSLHPTASTVAIGAKANELTSEHHKDIYPNGKKSPMYKMMQYESKIIGLGEKTVSLSFVHVVEDIMKDNFPVKTLSDKTIKCKVVNTQGETMHIETLVPHINIADRDIPGYISELITQNACKTIKFKGSNFFTVNPQLFFNEVKYNAEKGKTIYNF